MFTTSDTAFATWLGWRKQLVPLPQTTGSGRTYFLFEDLDEKAGVLLQHEYEQSEYFEFHVRYKALTQRTRGG